MKHETGIVGSSFPGQITIREGYSEFFNGLMDIVRDASAGRNGVDGQTGESLRSYVMDWLGLESIPCRISMNILTQSIYAVT